MRPCRAARAAASVSGSSTKVAITTPTKDCGNPAAAHQMLDRRRLLFGQTHHRHQRDQQQPQASHAAAVLGGSAWVSSSSNEAVLTLLRDRQEEVAVPHRLGEDEHQVEQQRGDRGEVELAG